MPHLLALIFIGAAIWIGILTVPLILVGGLRWDDVRSLFLHYAYLSFTYQGEVIPGVRPSPGTRLVIRAFSRSDDARKTLVTEAIAIADERNRLRAKNFSGRAPAMSLALEQARWFTAPAIGTRFRARQTW